ncbi:MAG: hypothetical protein SFU56_03300 [Capsulimonadales bacterium]|nr:hypothetical protein [Capsulimonadales bacterium]
MLTESERNALLLGDPNRRLPERVPLTAGPFSLTYENGDLRYLRFGDREVVRRIYVALRGENWFNVPGEISRVALQHAPDGFHITYQARYVNAERNIDLSADFTLTGSADGTVTFDFDAVAHTAFKRNRIGICVLHPATAAGTPVTVTHTDGRTESGMFPITIEPDQPFFDIAALTQEVAPGVTTVLRFEGDVFEMEDQRNWSDASYKTYSTPQERPKPVEVAAGTRIRQTVRLTVHRDTVALGDDAINADSETVGQSTAAGSFVLDAPVTVRIGAGGIAPFPGFGLMLPPDKLPLPEAAETALNGILLSHLRLDVDVTADGWHETVERANQVAIDQALPLLLGLKNFDRLRTDERGLELKQPVGAFLFLSASGEFIRDFGKSRPFLPEGAVLFTGSSNNFTELNRNRPDMSTVDGIVFAGTPQVHAFDDTSILETPPTYADQLLTARTFAAGKPVHVGPLTLYRPGRIAAVQQKGLLGAVWYVAALSYVAQGGAAGITLCDLSGDQGLLSDDGRAFPVYAALSAVGTSTGGRTQSVTISDPLRVACLSVLAEGAAWQDIFLVNLQPQTVTVELSGIQGVSARVRMLDETTGGRFSGVVPTPVVGGSLGLSLLPYAVIQVISGAQVS